MATCDSRLTPLSLRRALLLLVPLALLGAAFIGLLAPTASAHDTTLSAPVLTGPASPGSSATPTWTFDRPLDTTTTSDPVFDEMTGDTTTVTIVHDYDSECVYDAPLSADVVVPLGCGTQLSETQFTYEGHVADGEGTYVLTVTTVETTTKSTTTTTTSDGTSTTTIDSTGVKKSPSSSASYVYDIAPPKPTVSPPAPTGNDTSISWSFTQSAGTTATCTLSGPGIASPTAVGCSSPFATELTGGDGTYTLTVTLTDGGGSSTGSGSYLLDSAPPTAVPPAPSGPSGTGQLTPITWTIEALADHTTHCLLTTNGTAGSWTSCAGTFSVTPVNGSTYSLQARYVDAAGNPGSASAASASYTFDTTAPATPVITTDPGTTGFDTTPVWSFVPEAGATVTCSVTGGTLSGTDGPCSGTGTHTIELKNQLDGSYTLTVTVTDAGGLSTTATATYLLDRVGPTEPTVALSAGSPTSPSQSTDTTWNIDGDDDVVRTECRLERDGMLVEGHDWQTCALSVTKSLTTEGTYVLLVRQYDAAGNVSAVGRSLGFTIDNTPPAAPVVTGSNTSSQTPSATWDITHGMPAGTRFTCSLVVNGTAGAFEDCSSRYTISLTVEGTYRIDVYAYDDAGNRSTLTTGPTYTYDVTAPKAPAVSVTPTTDNVTSATWTVVPAETGTVTECRLVHTLGTVETQVFGWRTCTTFTFSLNEGDGGYTLSVRSVDAALNVSDVASATYVLDLTAPAVPIVSSDRTVKDNERTVTYTFSGEGDATCTIMNGKTVVHGPVACTSTFTYQLPDISGTYVLYVTYTDAVGNTSDPGASPPYELDVTPPAQPVVTSDRSGTDNEPVVTYGFSGEGTATCTLMRGTTVVAGPQVCTSPWVVKLTYGDGSYSLLVTYTDAVGNTSTAGASPEYLLDLTPPPAPVVSGPPATGNATTVSWSYSGEGTATCTLLLGGVATSAPFACGATGYTTTLPSDGSWSLQVTFTDAVGNTGPPGTSSTYLLDTAAPSAPGVSGPTGPSQNRSPSWTLSTETGTTIECRLLRGGTVVLDWTACSGSYTADLTGLPDGGYVVEARVTDKAGNLSATGRSAPYVLDSTAPVAAVVSGPSGPSQLRTPSFTWTGEAGATAECQLSRDGALVGGWVACASGYAPSLSGDGTWTLTVRLTDAAGNVSASATSGGYVLDTTAPAAPKVTPPQSPGRDLAPSWGAYVENGATLECRLLGADGTAGEWAACTLPHVTPLEGLPDGRYVLEIRATDAAGNVSAVGSGEYVLDTVAPAAAVVVAPTSPGRSTAPTFTFTTEAGATTTCRLTSGTTLVSDFAPCTSPASLDLTGLPDGTYTLTVRVTDAAGNPGPAATGTYVLDTTGPAAPVVTLSPASPSSSRSLTWAFTYETGSTLVCRLTTPTGAVRDIAGCTSPLTVDLTGLPDGTYTLTVHAVDAAGNVGAALTLTHVLDSNALAGPSVTGPVSPGSTRTPTWTLGTGTNECRLMRGTTVLRDWAACTSSYTADLFGQPDGTYTLQVRSRSATGAVSAATHSHYVLDTTAPAPATVVGPPTPSTNRLPTWSLASPEVGATAECRVLVFGSVLRDWAPCAISAGGSLHTVDLTGLGDGTYTLVVRVTDAAGNRGAEASSAYVLDTSAPVAVGVTGPPSPGNDTTPTWQLSTGGSASLECRLTSAEGVVSDWAPCEGEYTADLQDLPDGTYTLAVRAVSEAGTPGPETTSAYVLNTAAPEAPTALALSGVTSPGNSRTPTWTFTLPQGTTGHCTVLQGTRVVYDGPCSSPFRLDLSNAADGSYTLTVQAVDAAGNLSAGVSSTYVLDTVPTSPPVFTQVPGATGSTLDPQWRFTVVHGATAECRLLYEGRALGDWMPCTSPYTATLSGRPDGRYTLEVRAVDGAGNASSPIANSYVLDRNALPVTSFTATPETPGTDPTVSWAFTSPDGTTLECRLLAPDGTTAWSSCTTGTYRLDLTGRPDGDYSLEVRVVDADGRQGSAARATYTLDTTAPAAPEFTDTPPAAGSAADPSWHWDGSTDDLIECRLVRVDGSAVTAWAECGSPQTVDLTRLGDGTYAMEIRVVDAAGNVSAVTSAAYRYDTTSPNAPVFTSRPPSSGSDRTVSWTFVVPLDATATCTVTRGRVLVREGPCSGRYDLNLSGLPDGVYTLTVRFTDSAGNVSLPTSGSYTLSTLRVGGPVRVDPPRPAPTSPGGTGSVPISGPGRGGTAIVVPQDSTSRPRVPTIPLDDDVVRGSGSRPAASLPTRSAQEVAPDAQPDTGGTNPLLPGRLPVEDVPDVLRDVVTGTITRPTLPLALLAIVVLFLLAQNRIDRRDPKLASAPVEAEPELDFTAVIRRPGEAFS